MMITRNNDCPDVSISVSEGASARVVLTKVVAERDYESRTARALT
jgi:hypothetical protein